MKISNSKKTAGKTGKATDSLFPYRIGVCNAIQGSPPLFIQCHLRKIVPIKSISIS
jgi:hypothetical protein